MQQVVSILFQLKHSSHFCCCAVFACAILTVIYYWFTWTLTDGRCSDSFVGRPLIYCVACIPSSCFYGFGTYMSAGVCIHHVFFPPMSSLAIRDWDMESPLLSHATVFMEMLKSCMCVCGTDSNINHSKIYILCNADVCWFKKKYWVQQILVHVSSFIWEPC